MMNVPLAQNIMNRTKLYKRICTSAVALLLWTLVSLGNWAISSPAYALDYNRENLINTDFSGQVLTDASFTKANLRNSNLSHSDLTGVSFFAANLESANLEGANLTNATLDAARIINTNLTNAVLVGAFAANAKFDGATIDGADFTDVLLRQDEQDKLCKVAKGVNPTTGKDTRESLLCP